jgi:hypothetical protein
MEGTASVIRGLSRTEQLRKCIRPDTAALSWWAGIEAVAWALFISAASLSALEDEDEAIADNADGRRPQPSWFLSSGLKA